MRDSNEPKRRRVADRDYRLTAGTVCVVAVVSVALCALVALSALSQSTGQTGEAIDAAIAAYDHLLQKSERGDTFTDSLYELAERAGLAQTAAALQGATATDTGAAASNQSALLVSIAPHIDAFEHATSESGMELYVYFPANGLMVGRDWWGLARACPDRAIAALDLAALLSEGRTVSFQAPGDAGPNQLLKVMPVTDTVAFVWKQDMPDLPEPSSLSHLEGLVETYFIDRYGNWYAYFGNSYAPALDFAALDAGTDGDSGMLDVAYGGENLRVYYHDTCPGYDKFVIVVPDIAGQARQQLSLAICGVAALTALAGCLTGILLTRRVYAPVRQIVARLTPEGCDIRDEFRLIGYAVASLERRIGDQAQQIESYHVARLLHVEADAEPTSHAIPETEGLFFSDAPQPCSLVCLRPIVPNGDLGPGVPHSTGDPRDVDTLLALAHGHLDAADVACCLCTEAGFVFAVVENPGGKRDLGGLADELVRALHDQDRQPVTAFVSDVHAAPGELSLCYQEVLDLIARQGQERGGALPSVTVYDPDLFTGPGRRTAGDDGFGEIRAFVDANFRDPNLSASLVGRRFGVSQPAISRLFKTHGFEGFLAYLQSLRVEEARRLLVETDATVSAVADQVGFGNALTLTRSFKRIAGTTPGAYREAVRGNSASGDSTRGDS